jgi:hypothetical protein
LKTNPIDPPTASLFFSLQRSINGRVAWSNSLFFFSLSVCHSLLDVITIGVIGEHWRREMNKTKHRTVRSERFLIPPSFSYFLLLLPLPLSSPSLSLFFSLPLRLFSSPRHSYFLGTLLPRFPSPPSFSLTSSTSPSRTQWRTASPPMDSLFQRCLTVRSHSVWTMSAQARHSD